MAEPSDSSAEHNPEANVGGHSGALTDLLHESSIRLTAMATSREDAIRQAGAALHETGAVESSYSDAMLQREQAVSTFVGNAIAIPHGTLAARDSVIRDALVVLRFPAGVDWDGSEVRVCVGIAASGNGHIALLSELASVLLDPERADALANASTSDEVYEALRSEADED